MDYSVYSGYDSSRHQIRKGYKIKFISTEALPEEFIGEWKYQYEENELIYVFNADGTGTYSYRSTSDIRWDIESDTEIRIRTYNEDGSSSTMTYNYEFITDDNSVLEINGVNYWKQ